MASVEVLITDVWAAHGDTNDKNVQNRDGANALFVIVAGTLPDIGDVAVVVEPRQSYIARTGLGGTLYMRRAVTGRGGTHSVMVEDES